MKYCRDCASYRGNLSCVDTRAEPFTRMVEGVSDQRNVNALVCRLVERMCGVDAKWWQQGPTTNG
jgi:hypothetical protein